MLKRISSETELLLEPVVFEPGINIILGKYSDDPDASGVNGIGKSSLVRMIDFALVSDTAEKLFGKKRYSFLRDEKHSVELEFDILGEEYVLKREFHKLDTIYFGKTRSDLTEYTRSDIKKILGNKYFPTEDQETFVPGNRFRTLMSFFVKDDLDHQQRVDPFTFVPYKANKRELAIYNYYLMGLTTRNIVEYDTLLNLFKKKRDEIKSIEEKIRAETGKEVSEVKSEQVKLEDSVKTLEESLKEYSFLEGYKDVEKQLVEVTTKIDALLKEYNSLNRKLRNVTNSFHQDPSLDTRKIERIYNQARAEFGTQVKKSLEEVQSFNREILENRNKFLMQKERALQDSIEELLRDISVLEEERSHLYKFLEEKGAMDSVKNAYENMLKKRSALEATSKDLRRIDTLDIEKDDIDIDLVKTKKAVLKNLKENEMKVKNLRRSFQDILKNALFLGEDFSSAYFDVDVVRDTQREQLPVEPIVEIPRADALGQSRLKIVAYDLMIFLSSITTGRKLPNFLIHDGVFHGVAKRTVVNTLNYLYSQSLQHPSFQYIVTFNEDEIHIPPNKESSYGKFSFDPFDRVVATYEDTAEKMAFKRAFN